MSSYSVRLSPRAAKRFQKLPEQVRARVRRALLKLAADVGAPGRVRGKRVKTIKGNAETFHRLRVGDHRILYEPLEEDCVLHVMDIVARKDLDTWLKNR